MNERPDGLPGRRVGALAALALVLALGPAGRAAAADDGPASDIEAVPLESLVDLSLGAASLHQERASEAAAAVFVLTGDDLAAHGFRTLGEALRSVPGLYGYRDDSFGMVGVRGVGLLADYGTRLLVLLDGHPLNDSVGLGGTLVGRDFPIPLDAVKRVEVIKGPVGSVYGPTAFLGLINVVTVDADDRASQLRLGGELSQGRWLGEEGALVLSDRVGPVRVTAALQGLRSSGYDVRLPELLVPLPGRPAALDPVVRGANRSSGQSAFARLQWNGLVLAGACGGSGAGLVTAAYGSLIGSDQTRLSTASCFVDLAYTRDLGERLTLAVRAAWDGSTYRDLYLYPPPPDGTGPFRDVGRDRWGTVDARATWRPADGTLIIGGATGQLHRTLQQAYADGLPTIQQDPVNGVGPGDIPKRFATVNGYLLLEQRLADSLRLHLGATWFWHELFGQRVTPKAALVWSPTSADAVKVVYSQGFRAPTVSEAYYEDDTTYLANPRLRAELVGSGELIWARRLGPGASVTASAFLDHYNDLIRYETVPAPGVASPDPANPLDFRQQARNQGTLWLRGGEVSFTARWGRWLTGWGGLSLQSLSAAGRANAPGLIGNLALSSRAPWEPLTLSLHAAGLASRELDSANLPADGRRSVGPQVLLGAAARLDLPWVRGLSVEAGVSNLLDAAAPDPLAPDFRPVTRLPQPPRTFRLDLRYHPN